MWVTMDWLFMLFCLLFLFLLCYVYFLCMGHNGYNGLQFGRLVMANRKCTIRRVSFGTPNPG